MTAPLAEYKDLFGAPNTGLHAYRIVEIAAVDFAASVILILIIIAIFGTHPPATVGIVFISGILAHRLFGVRTTVDKLLFSES
jgi:hypothetical protein